MAATVSHIPYGLNQSPPFKDVNLYETDRVLQEAVAREGARNAGPALSAFGARAGSAESFELARKANENPPVLSENGPQDGGGEICYDPAYHELMRISMEQGLHCSTWDHLREASAPKEAAHVARCAAFYMAAQMEAGHCCPITMTHAGVAALQNRSDLLGQWLPKVLTRRYDPAFAPVADKASATFGMGMTEVQAGTDVRANTTRAEPLDGGAYAITGHKFFFSAPMSDAFLVLAQAPRGLSCFLMPRFVPDGGVNAIRIVRLKDKLGNRSNASAEVEFDKAYGWLVGEEGRGIPTILDMVTLTRLDCAVSSAGLMRFALAQAIHHCRYRTVFQKKLVDQPLMERVLAAMALYSEAATTLVFRLARAYDGADEERAAASRRLLTPAVKYWVCKTAPAFACEAMECLGGIGYVEDASPLARVYREMPVNAIWEGSGNVMCLDVLRVVQREPETVELVLEDIVTASHGEPRLKSCLERIKDLLANRPNLEANGRVLTGTLAELAAGAVMYAHAPREIADLYLSTRFSTTGQGLYGSAEIGAAGARAAVERALPPG